MPPIMIEACEKKNITPFIVGFKGQTDPDIVKGHYHLWTRLGTAGQVIQTLKSHDIRDIVMIGSIRRPSLDELRPDWQTAKLLARMGFRVLGDDGILKALRSELEKKGFEICAIQDYVSDILTKAGTYGNIAPGKQHQKDIKKGIDIARELGKLDIGQACVIQNGLVLGVEAIEGTDALIQRCGALKRKGKGPVLVKVSKPGQDENIDLPTIGPQTIENAASQGFSGIGAEAGKSLMIKADTCTLEADKAGIFLHGVEVDENDPKL